MIPELQQACPKRSRNATPIHCSRLASSRIVKCPMPFIHALNQHALSHTYARTHASTHTGTLSSSHVQGPSSPTERNKAYRFNLFQYHGGNITPGTRRSPPKPGSEEEAKRKVSQSLLECVIDALVATHQLGSSPLSSSHPSSLRLERPTMCRRRQTRRFRHGRLRRISSGKKSRPRGSR